MIFNSYTFFIFFCFVLIIYYLLASWRTRKLFLLGSSYLFYAAWNPPFVMLILISTIVDWRLAKIIYSSESIARQRIFMMVSLFVNLGLLGFFKYGDFFLDNVIAFLHIFKISYAPPQLNIILPVGISFYTFQTLSYTLDIYRGRGKPWHSFLDYALYVTFFPQLVAGPIVRASSFLAQCQTPKSLSGQNLGWGLSLLTLGLFEKSVIADALLAPIVEILYSGSGTPDFFAAWGGTLAFSGQIFCDFAGYSTCAIGTALCLGFALPQNFRFPYAAVGFSDFWRRWHITLSTWLRDYLYIPLGGNRQGTLRTHSNLMITMLLGGFWHGASWTFVAWGGLHGGYLIAERMLHRKLGHQLIWQHPMLQLLLAAMTFLLVCLSWVFFRATSFTQATAILSAMLMISSEPVNILLGRESLAIALATTLAIVCLHWLLRDRDLMTLIHRLPWWGMSVGLAGMLYAIATMPGQDQSFIYFQF